MELILQIQITNDRLSRLLIALAESFPRLDGESDIAWICRYLSMKTAELVQSYEANAAAAGVMLDTEFFDAQTLPS